MHKGNEKRQTILEVVERDPGIGFIEIQKITGFANGTLSHHLKALQREETIRIKRDARKIWVFRSYHDPSEDLLRIFLRKETCKKILAFLLENKTASFSDIRDAIKKSPSTTSITLKTLIDKNLIEKIYDFPHKYMLVDYEKTVNTISAMQSSQTDSLKENFADVFSYY